MIIAINDDAHGVFKLYSADPRALDDGQTITAEERDKFSVELVVEREGKIDYRIYCRVPARRGFQCSGCNKTQGQG